MNQQFHANIIYAINNYFVKLNQITKHNSTSHDVVNPKLPTDPFLYREPMHNSFVAIMFEATASKSFINK